MRFCPHCGAPLMAGAKFCVECGRQLDESAGPAAGTSGAAAVQRNPPKPPSSTGIQLTTAFIVVFVGITIIGLGATAYILTRPTPVPRLAQDTVPPATDQAATGDAQNAPPGAATGAQGETSLPPGHPRVELPTEARTLIDKIEQEADSKPRDIDAWVKLGNVCMRAALFDQAYYPKAANAYARVLKLDPENIDALRGIGDIDYDQQHYDEAAAAYEHYLKHRPKDPEVITDLGTMYLYTSNPDQAIVQYKKAIAIKPDLYQPYFNLGVAYGEQGDKGNSAIAFTKAISLAPDDDRRNQAKSAFAKYTGMPAEQAVKIAATLPTPAASSSPAAQSASAADAAAKPQGPATFHSSLEENVRNIPFAGPESERDQLA